MSSSKKLTIELAGKQSWDKWKKKFPKTIRILTPHGKDPTEALQHGVNLRDWILTALPKTFQKMNET